MRLRSRCIICACLLGSLNPCKRNVLISIMDVSPVHSSKAILSNEIFHRYLRDLRQISETDYCTHFHISFFPLPPLFQITPTGFVKYVVKIDGLAFYFNRCHCRVLNPRVPLLFEIRWKGLTLLLLVLYDVVVVAQIVRCCCCCCCCWFRTMLLLLLLLLLLLFKVVIDKKYKK